MTNEHGHVREVRRLGMRHGHVTWACAPHERSSPMGHEGGGLKMSTMSKVAHGLTPQPMHFEREEVKRASRL
eukprot:scaffold241145_cov28-Tisochrysis_lutea.AAC.1